MTIKKSIYIGKTRRKVEHVELIMTRPKNISDDEYVLNASIIGLPDQFNRSMTSGLVVHEKEETEDNPLYPSLEKVIDARSEFDLLVLAMAYFRQTLRLFIENNPSVKLYGKFQEDLEALEIEDLFWTHDCVPD